MAKFNWQNGTLVSKAKVEIDGKVYEVEPEQYEGQTPTSAENFNKMQDGIYEDIDANKEAINTLSYNVVTNGDAVKTGRKIDGKDEYVKRFKINISNRQGTAPLGFILSNVTIVEMKGIIYSDSNNVFNLDTNNFGLGGSANCMTLLSGSNMLNVKCNSDYFNTNAVVMIYYINNN